MNQKDKELLNNLSTFNGVYLSGFYIKNKATVTALSLLFEKVHLPNQLEMVIEFAKNYLFDPENRFPDIKIEIESIEDEGGQDDPLAGLNEVEKLTAQKYLYVSQMFCIHNHELFPTIFTTDMLENNKVLDVKLIKKGVKGKLNKYRVTPAPQIVSLNGLSAIKTKLDNGFVPIIGQEKLYDTALNVFKDNKAVASILAMKSVEMLLPSFKSAAPGDILEARDKLKDHLAPFWTSMLKLSMDAKKIIKDSKTSKEAIDECQNIVDTIVRPALVELIVKMEKERKNWFYRIVSPVANTVKLFVGNPPLTQAALIKSSLALATEMTSEYVQSKQKIEDLKSESGLTYLLEVHRKLRK
jgi:hypothetical protein